MQQDYRGDIQGLRALAVLLVALDHAAIGPFHGGFVGVDVFFVISGYLITSLLIREGARTGRVSLRDFYARRARRILPAAMLVVLATVALSVLFLDGASALLVSEQAVWATFFAANVKFAIESTDYFAADQAVSPLQHYWSLAVEEQFYLVWPLVLLGGLFLLHRLRRGRAGDQPEPRLPVARLVAAVAGVVLVVSFAWSLHVTAASPLSAYFSTTARAWELAVGALLAAAVPLLVRIGATPRAVGSWLGVALVVGTAVLASAATPFPGWAAVPPVAGAALLLVGGLGETRTWGPQGVLSLRPVRAVGDWSYSFYLWHWPLLVVAGALYGSISGWRGAAVLALALGLAAATYRLVETPFRTSRVLTRARRGRMRSLLLYPAMVVVVLPTVAAADHAVRSDLDGGGAAISTSQFGQQEGDPRPALGKDQYVALVRASVMAARNGLDVPAGLDPDPLELRESIPDLGDCDYYGMPVDDDLPLCARGDVDADRSLVLIGDSHGRQWVPALERIADTYGYRAYYLVLQGCPGLDQTPWLKNGDEPQLVCQQFQDWAVEQVEQLRPALTVLATDVDEIGYSDAEGRHVTDDAVVEEMAQAGMAAQVERVAPYSGQTVVIGDPPQRTVSPTQCLTDDDATLEGCLSAPDQRSVTMIFAVRRGALAAGADYIGTIPWFCHDGACPAVVGDRVTHRDLEHVSIPYAEWLAPEIAARIGLDD